MCVCECVCVRGRGGVLGSGYISWVDVTVLSVLLEK